MKNSLSIAVLVFGFLHILPYLFHPPPGLVIPFLEHIKSRYGDWVWHGMFVVNLVGEFLLCWILLRILTLLKKRAVWPENNS